MNKHHAMKEYGEGGWKFGTFQKLRIKSPWKEKPSARGAKSPLLPVNEIG